MQIDFLSNAKKSLFLFNCKINGNTLEYSIGIFHPYLKPEQLLRADPKNAVNIALTEDCVGLEKKITKFNGQITITKPLIAK